MAKPKPTTEDIQPLNKIHPDDIAEFKAALDEVEIGALDPAEAAEIVAEEEQVERGGRKITVHEEAKSPARKNPHQTATTDSLDQVWNNKLPEEMQQLTKSRSSGVNWGWLVTILVIIAGVSVAGFFVFNRVKRFTGNNVQLQFKPITQVASGSTITLTLEYQNLEPVDLTKAELTVEYPDGFSYTSSKPTATNDFKNAFNLGTIRSGQAGTVTITGSIIGTVGDTKDFSAILTYVPTTFNSEFQQKTYASLNITSSILTLAVTGPTELEPAATGTWTIDYKNTSDHDLTNIQIEALYPDGFTVGQVKPAARERSAVWGIDKLNPEQSGTITFAGQLAGNLGDSFSLTIKAGIQSSTGTVDPQDEQTMLVILAKNGLTATVVVNGNTDVTTVAPGETLNYSIRLANNSNAEIKEAVVSVDLSGTALDITKFVSDTNGQLDKTTVSWTKTQVPMLANIRPDETVSLSFAVDALAGLDVKQDQDKDPQITASVYIKSAGSVANTNSASLPSVVVITKISTILKLSAEARYYDNQGAVVGSGTLPPTVGKTTSYLVTWTAMNTTSDLSTMAVSATLPNTVMWTGQKLSRDAGDLTFDPATRQIRWTINTVPAGTGSRTAALTAKFEVSITPTADQVDTVPILLDITTVTATDSFTKRPISITAAALSTDVPSDAQAGGEGRVRAL